ncbi:MAG: HEAT repeat domain-containing protein [Planctomycetota bacterium]|nr:HEAT repeat domain-containing protein [Planctomycetota bacterium]
MRLVIIIAAGALIALSAALVFGIRSNESEPPEPRHEGGRQAERPLSRPEARVTSPATVEGAPRAPTPAVSSDVGDAAESHESTDEPPLETASRLVSLLEEIASQTQWHKESGVAYTEEELSGVIGDQSKADALTARLGRSLRDDPDQWDEVLQLILSLDDRELGRKIIGMLGRFVDDRSEGIFIEQLQTSPVADTRLLAITALAGRSTPGSLSALLDVAETDLESAVRRRAVGAIAAAWRRSDEAGRSMIEEALRSRAEHDEDDAVRNDARRTLDRIESGSRGLSRRLNRRQE